MKALLSALAAAVLGTAVLAQTPPPQTPPQPPPQTPAATSNQAEQVTLLGCVQNESDYRRAQDKNRGGVAGTGIGAGNEYILANASMARQGLSPAASPADPAYELTGPNESKVKEFVGKRVEISGTLKPAETTASGKPTGGATAGKPPTGVDVLGEDLKLRELEVMTVKAAAGTCPPM
jgi:hypothetical protein